MRFLNDQPGSWGLWAKYYNQGLGTVASHTMNGYYYPMIFGFQGWGGGVNYTLAKNMVASVEYYDLSSKNTGLIDMTTKTWWSQLNVTF